LGGVFAQSPAQQRHHPVPPLDSRPGLGSPHRASPPGLTPVLPGRERRGRSRPLGLLLPGSSLFLLTGAGDGVTPTGFSPRDPPSTPIGIGGGVALAGLPSSGSAPLSGDRKSHSTGFLPRIRLSSPPALPGERSPQQASPPAIPLVCREPEAGSPLRTSPHRVHSPSL
jgi:hypothetical protein